MVYAQGHADRREVLRKEDDPFCLSAEIYHSLLSIARVHADHGEMRLLRCGRPSHDHGRGHGVHCAKISAVSSVQPCRVPDHKTLSGPDRPQQRISISGYHLSSSLKNLFTITPPITPKSAPQAARKPMTTISTSETTK